MRNGCCVDNPIRTDFGRIVCRRLRHYPLCDQHAAASIADSVRTCRQSPRQRRDNAGQNDSGNRVTHTGLRNNVPRCTNTRLLSGREQCADANAYAMRLHPRHRR